jgi:hypothetical protein
MITLEECEVDPSPIDPFPKKNECFWCMDDQGEGVKEDLLSLDSIRKGQVPLL